MFYENSHSNNNNNTFFNWFDLEFSLTFLTKEAQKKDEALLKFPEKLTQVQSAAR